MVKKEYYITVVNYHFTNFLKKKIVVAISLPKLTPDCEVYVNNTKNFLDHVTESRNILCEKHAF